MKLPDHLITQEGMTVEQNRSMSLIRQIAMRSDFPKPVDFIGCVKLYDARQIRAYFEKRRANLKRKPRR
jgi:hypothetical protein